MSTVIYISNKQIQVITAKGSGPSAKPDKSFILDSPEGSVINGIVMDPEAMITFMKGFFTQTGISTKDVDDLLLKVIDAPPERSRRRRDRGAR